MPPPAITIWDSLGFHTCDQLWRTCGRVWKLEATSTVLCMPFYGGWLNDSIDKTIQNWSQTRLCVFQDMVTFPGTSQMLMDINIGMSPVISISNHPTQPRFMTGWCNGHKKNILHFQELARQTPKKTTKDSWPNLINRLNNTRLSMPNDQWPRVK